MSYLNVATGIGSDFASLSGFDRRDPASYVSKGQAIGGLLGTGVGLMATPFLGPAGIMIGRQIGSMIGQQQGQKRANELIDMRRDRQEIAFNMHSDLSNQREAQMAVDKTRSYLDSKVIGRY